MDEPFAGNDVFNREDFYRVLLGILEPTETILLSTHGAATCAMLNAIDPPEGFFWRGGVPYNCSYAIVDVIDGEPELVAENQIWYAPA